MKAFRSLINISYMILLLAMVAWHYRCSLHAYQIIGATESTKEELSRNRVHHSHHFHK
jgi:hypothetical protein